MELLLKFSCTEYLNCAQKSHLSNPVTVLYRKLAHWVPCLLLQYISATTLDLLSHNSIQVTRLTEPVKQGKICSTFCISGKPMMASMEHPKDEDQVSDFLSSQVVSVGF